MRVMARIKRMLLLWTAIVIGVAGCTTKPSTNVGKLSFAHPLHIPPLLEPEIDADGRKHYTLTLQTGVTSFLPGKLTETWGVNGSYLGPTIRVSRGDRVSVKVVNRLNETSTLHWHGMRLPAVMDGGPHQPIEPGSSWSPYWTIDQPAATTWYHPHLHGSTATHVYRGLAGLFLVDDADSAKLSYQYGIDDIPLIVQDKRFSDDGSLNVEPNSAFGLLGDDILINGTYNPYLKVSASRVRFRLLNASNARTYDIGFADGRSFHVIGNDAGLLPKPVHVERVKLSPGERADIVAEFKPGEQTVLHSKSGSNGLDGGEFELLKLIAADELSASPPLPQMLSAEPPIDAPPGAKVRSFRLTAASRINGKAMDMYRIDEAVPAGAREIWEVANTGWAHNFHIHDAAFRILEVNGRSPRAYESGRKDTVFIPGGVTVRLAVDFGQYPDPDHPYMFHCHILRHEDDGMMGQFVIVKPGTESLVPRRLSGIGGMGTHSGSGHR